MLCWRLVISKVATKKELDECWTVDDILKANAILDFKDEVNKVMLSGIDKGKDK